MTDTDYMKIAIKEAIKAKKNKDVPVGAVIVNDKGKIVSKSFNKKNKKQNAIYHAEILAINKACKKIKNFRLDKCTIYVTFEPCLMCMGAILSARMQRLVFGAKDNKFEVVEKTKKFDFNHQLEIVGGVMELECANLLTEFFKEVRNEKLQHSS